uniref:Uncharacterized protein n=1 Tax=Vitrella brassicaformis TaxID=1169539 RepID=A0A7S1KFL9_9ALVE
MGWMKSSIDKKATDTHTHAMDTDPHSNQVVPLILAAHDHSRRLSLQVFKTGDGHVDLEFELRCHRTESEQAGPGLERRPSAPGGRLEAKQHWDARIHHAVEHS